MSIDCEVFDAEFKVSTSGATKFKTTAADPIAKATALRNELRRNRRNAIMLIYDIMRPHIPLYSVGIFLIMLTRAFEAPLWTYAFPSCAPLG